MIWLHKKAPVKPTARSWSQSSRGKSSSLDQCAAEGFAESAGDDVNPADDIIQFMRAAAFIADEPDGV